MLHDGTASSDRSTQKSCSKDAAVMYRRKMEDKRLRKQDQARTKARERRSNENQAILDLQYTLPMNGGLLRTVDKATVLRLTNRYMLLRYQLSQLLLHNRGSPLRAPVHRSLIVVTTERATGSILYVSPYLEHITRHPWYGMIGQPLASFAMESVPWKEGDLVRMKNNCPAGVKAKGERKVSELSVFRVVSSLSAVDLSFYLLHWLPAHFSWSDPPRLAPPLRYAFLTFHQHDWTIVRAYSRVFGLDEGSLVGNSLFDCVHIDDIAPLYQSLQRLTDKHSHVTTDCCRWKLGQGYVWVVIHATQVTQEQGSRVSFVCQQEIAHSEDTPPELLRPPLIVDTSYSSTSGDSAGEVIEDGPVDWWHDDCASMPPGEMSPLMTEAFNSDCSRIVGPSGGLRRCSSSHNSVSSTQTIVNVSTPESLIQLPAVKQEECSNDTCSEQGIISTKQLISDLSTKSIPGNALSGSHTSLLYRLLQNKEDEHSPVTLHRSSSSTAGSLSPVDGDESCLEKMEVIGSMPEVSDLEECLVHPPIQGLFEELGVDSSFFNLTEASTGLPSDLNLCSDDLNSETLLEGELV